MQICRQQVADGFIYRDLVLCGSLGCAARIGFESGDERYAKPRRLQFAIDAQVIVSKGSRAGDGNPYDGFPGDRYTSLPSTALRQRL